MRRHLFIYIALASALMAQAQNYQYRYWFDNDHAAQKTGSTTGTTELSIDASTLGLHQLHALRMQVQSGGTWSSVATRYFLRAADGTGATGRYWIDNDHANAKEAPTVKGLIDLDLTGLAVGLHAVHYQTFAQDGIPSAVRTQFFLMTDNENQQLTCLVWFDDDEENAQRYAVTGEDIRLKVKGLTIGTHEVTVVLYDGAGVAVGRDTQEFEVEGGKDYVTLSTVGRATYSSDSDLDFSRVKGVKAYIASGYDVKERAILLTRVTRVPAGTGLILIGEPQASYEIPQASISFVYANMLKGAVADKTLTPTAEGYTHFMLKDGAEGSAFYPLEGDTPIEAGAVYLAIPTSVLPAEGAISMVLSEGVRGDVNDDGQVTITDAVSVVNIILNGGTGTE